MKNLTIIILSNCLASVIAESNPPLAIVIELASIVFAVVCGVRAIVALERETK